MRGDIVAIQRERRMWLAVRKTEEAMRAVGVDIAKVRKHRTSPWAIVIAGVAIATFIGLATAGSVLFAAINADARVSGDGSAGHYAEVDVAAATLGIAPSPVIDPNPAANNVDKAALKKATAECREQVKAYAQYNETSWWARHQMLKKCIADPNRVCQQC
jgi:hypothetical protein